MTANKTQPNKLSVNEYLSNIQEPARRADAKELCRLLAELTSETPVMWGSSIVGFGSYHYRYASGREGDWMRIGFASRKNDLTLYILSGLDRHQDLLQDIGPHKTGKSCLYIKSLKDIDRQRLITLIKDSLAYMAKTYPN